MVSICTSRSTTSPLSDRHHDRESGNRLTIAQVTFTKGGKAVKELTAKQLATLEKAEQRYLDACSKMLASDRADHERNLERPRRKRPYPMSWKTWWLAGRYARARRHVRRLERRYGLIMP